MATAKVVSEFEELLNVYLTLAKINRVELAQELGISKSSLSNKLTGTRKFTAAELHKLVSFFVENRAITKLEQIEQLVALGGLSLQQVFTEADWHQEPLSRFLRDVKKLSNTPQKKPSNIPSPLTGIVGRDHQIDTITNLIKNKVRLLTITGPGGVGKTRISVEVAKNLDNYYRDGVWWVNLASVNTAPLMLSAVSKIFGLADQAGKTTIESLKEHLADKQCLLVLDNFEQLVETNAAEEITELLLFAPGLKILVTSRILLRVYGEYEFVLTTLSLPEVTKLPELKLLADFSAVELFVERAQAVDPFFTLSESNAGAVVKICKCLDGLPLAIELAVAGLRFMSPERLLKQMEDQTPAKVLPTGARNLPVRHQSLQSVFDWSYNLLNEFQRSFLQKLAIFRSGISLAAACAVSGLEQVTVSDLFTQLSSASWLQPVQVNLTEPVQDILRLNVRVTILQVAKEYLLERLEETTTINQVKQTFSQYFTELAEQAGPELQAGLVTWLEIFELEHDNLRAMWEWSQENQIVFALRASAPLGWFWYQRGFVSVGLKYLEALIKHPDAKKNEYREFLAKALIRAGWLHQLLGNFDRAKTLYLESLDITTQINNYLGMADALLNLGNINLQQAKYLDAQGYYEHSLYLYRTINLEQKVALALLNLGTTAYYQQDEARAINFFEQSLEMYRNLNNQLGIIQILNNLSVFYQARKDYLKAKSLIQEALYINVSLGNKGMEAMLLVNLGNLEQEEELYEQAEKHYEQSLFLAFLSEDQRSIAETLEALALVNYKLQKLDRSARFMSMATNLRTIIGIPVPNIDAAKLNELCTQLENNSYKLQHAFGEEFSLEKELKAMYPNL